MKSVWGTCWDFREICCHRGKLGRGRPLASCDAESYDPEEKGKVRSPGGEEKTVKGYTAQERKDSRQISVTLVFSLRRTKMAHKPECWVM